MATNKLGMKTRAAARKRTRIFGMVSYYNQSSRGRIVDLSATGLAMDLEGAFHAADGSRVRIESEELGVLEGTVTWCRSGRLGIRFNPNSNANAKVSSYFRFFHKDVKPVLTR